MLRLATIPLRLAPALTIVVLSAALAVAYQAGPFGWPLMFILAGWFFRYSFEFLDGMIGGAREAPVLSIEMLTNSIGEWRTLLPLILTVAVFFVSGATSYWIGVSFTAVALLSAAFVFPAVLAIQGWTGKVRQALSPIHWVHMVRLLGADYARIVACATLITTACAISLYLPTPAMFRIAMSCYAWLAVIALTGGIVYLRRDEIERETDFLDKRKIVESPAEIAQRREEIIDSIYAAWRGGAQENAWRTLIRHVEASQEPLAELRILYLRVNGWDGPQLAHRVAEELLCRLLEHDCEGEALILARERLAIDVGFRPRGKEELLRLADIANASADRATAQALLKNLPK